MLKEGIHHKPFPPKIATYIRRCYRNGESVGSLAVRHDTHAEKIRRTVKGVERREKKKRSFNCAERNKRALGIL